MREMTYERFHFILFLSLFCLFLILMMIDCAWIHIICQTHAHKWQWSHVYLRVWSFFQFSRQTNCYHVSMYRCKRRMFNVHAPFHRRSKKWIVTWKSVKSISNAVKITLADALSNCMLFQVVYNMNKGWNLASDPRKMRIKKGNFPSSQFLSNTFGIVDLTKTIVKW